MPSNEGKGGNFVIGNLDDVIGKSVTFWSHSWWMENELSGGQAPPSFKGFDDEGYEDENSPAECGKEWTTDPGNSSMPPEGPLPTYLYVIVSSEVTKSGSAITGNTVAVVLVKTNPGYGPVPAMSGRARCSRRSARPEQGASRIAKGAVLSAAPSLVRPAWPAAWGCESPVGVDGAKHRSRAAA